MSSVPLVDKMVTDELVHKPIKFIYSDLEKYAQGLIEFELQEMVNIFLSHKRFCYYSYS